MLLEAAIGDAYGAGFEFVEREVIEAEHRVLTYRDHPRWTGTAGCYTDDTQMSLAVAELMLNGKEWNAESIAAAFVETYQRDPRHGYSSRTRAALTDSYSGQEFLEKVQSKSNRNGAVMRAWVIGLYPEEKKVLAKADLQASISHNTPESRQAAQAIALAFHVLYYRRLSKDKLGDYLQQYMGGQWQLGWQGKVTMLASEAVRAALQTLKDNDQMDGVLRDSVALGGDVDTVASLALALGSVCTEIEQNLPRFCFDALENGSFGKDYLEKLDRELKHRFPQIPLPNL